MLSPSEAVEFQGFVLAAYDSKEFICNWERLRGLRLDGDDEMMQFIEDMRELWEILR